MVAGRKREIPNRDIKRQPLTVCLGREPNCMNASHPRAPSRHPEQNAGPGLTDEHASAKLTSESRLRGRTHTAIVHNKEIYLLRQTRSGKLILAR